MRVLIVGSLGGELGAAARLAISRGAKLVQADDLELALVRLRSDAAVDIVLCDVDLDVPALLGSMTAERIAVPVVACGPESGGAAAVRAVRAGAREFLPLPPDPELIAAILQAASRNRHVMIVRDETMAACVRRAEQVAGAEASVLITGESGTGKEVLARHIHQQSRRCAGPFVALNCAAIPENLLESELFGHEKGAFTGAIARRIGRFEAAEGGTLLLDEIGELDLHLQAKLLRVVQEREVERVGGGVSVRVDVRILAATHRDLMAEVERGTFREDLFFRLNVVAIRVPSLRERPGDVLALAEHFARRYADVNALPFRPIGRDGQICLAAHQWRGNVRELENVMHRAVLLATGAEIGADAIELHGLTAPVGKEVGATENKRAPGLDDFVGRRIDEVEREFILSTLRHTMGNRTHAATILGISIRALRNKLRDYATSGVRVTPPMPGAMASVLLSQAN